jgi:hypothetical protein
VKAKNKKISKEVKRWRSYNINNTFWQLPIDEQLRQHSDTGMVSPWLDTTAFTTTTTTGLSKGPQGLIFTSNELYIDPDLNEEEGQWCRVDNGWLWLPEELFS